MEQISELERSAAALKQSSDAASRALATRTTALAFATAECGLLRNRIQQFQKVTAFRAWANVTAWYIFPHLYPCIHVQDRTVGQAR